MVTACVAGSGGGRMAALELQGSTLVAEIFECCGVLEEAESVVCCAARLLKAKGTLVEASITTGDVFHVCVGRDGGLPSWLEAVDPDMQGIFAVSGIDEADPGPQQGLAEGLGLLLHHLLENISEIEGAVLNLSFLLRTGPRESSM
jgi:hypothetical protein